MPDFTDSWLPGSRGFWPNQSPLGAVPDTLIDGSNVVPVGPGYLTTFGGLLATPGIAAATMMPVKDTFGGLGSGSVIYHRGDTYWYIGSGSVSVGASALSPSATATSNLQFRKTIGGSNILAGVPTPTTAQIPVLATNGAGTMTGTHSVKIAWKRSSTGAVGNSSEASASVSTSNNKLQITIASIPANIDLVRVYACRRGFSTTGPWYFLSEHTVTPGGGSTTITALGPNDSGQWADGDLAAELAPIENYSPVELSIVGTHVLALGSVMVIIDQSGGYYYSFPTYPETFSPERFASLPGPVIGIQARAADGFAYVWGANYLAALIATPNGHIIPRIMWATVGFPNADAACLIESELWGWSGEPIRTTQSGDPDTSFALPVRDYLRQRWAATMNNTVCGYSPEFNAMVYCNGSEAIAYYRALDAWSTILTVSGGVVAAVTDGRMLLLSPGSGSSLGRFGAGGGVAGTALSAFRHAGAPQYRKTIHCMRHICEGAVRIDVMTNLDRTTVKGTQTLTGAVDAHGKTKHLNIQNAQSYAMKYSLGAGESAYSSTVDGVVEMVGV
jgi:hypothetical protein